MKAIVCAQVFPLEGEVIRPTILMQRTATCSVTVLSEHDQPIPGARVSLAPNTWYHGWGNGYLGIGIDQLTSIRAELKSGEQGGPIVAKQRVVQANEFDKRYSATTDAHGVAFVPGLPADKDDGGIPRKYERLFVKCEGYIVTANPPSPDFPLDQQPTIVHFKPGETSRVTVHMQKVNMKTEQVNGTSK